MTDAELARAVSDTVVAFNTAIKNALSAGLEVTAEYRDPERYEVQQRGPLFVGGGLSAKVARPILSDA